MDEMVAWLRAQLDEDERAAEAALHPDAVRPGTWSVERYADGPELSYIAEDKAGHFWTKAHEVFTPTAEHIARHDPARVLRDVAAKRAIVDRLADDAAIANDPLRAQRATTTEWFLVTAARDVLRHLAAAYADRPGYREAWRP